jgi:hypothetical protein
MILLLACAETPRPPAVPITAPSAAPLAAATTRAPQPDLPPPPPAWPAELPTRLVLLTAEGDTWVVRRPCVGDTPTLEVDGEGVWILGESSALEHGAYTGILINKAGYTLRYQSEQGPRERTLVWGDAARTWLHVGEQRYAVPSAVGEKFVVRAAECGG